MGEVKRSLGAVSYVELIYALQNDVPFGLVQNHEGRFIKADLGSVTAAADGAARDLPDDLRFSPTDAPGRSAYPVCGAVWAVLYVNQPADKGQQVVDFLRWCTHDGQEYCAGLHYAKLPKGLVEKVDKKLDSIKVK